MNYEAAQVARLRAVCPGAELWDEGGVPLVLLPDMKVESVGLTKIVDALLCPRGWDGYDTKLFFATNPAKPLNWQAHVIKTRTWHAAS